MVHWPDETTAKTVDIELVVDTAHDWAGEYGFVQPELATRIFEACGRILPDKYRGDGHMVKDCPCGGKCNG